MSSNPYQAQNATELNDGINKVSIRPVELLKRSYEMIKDQYGLFLAITFVGTFIGSLVPMAILLGPMMVGIYFCFLDLEQGKQVEFGRMFEGFNKFTESIVATLIMVGVYFVLMIPAMIIMVVAIIVPAAMAEQNGADGEAFAVFGFLAFYPVLILMSIVSYLPFLFAYQLIAERGVSGVEAVKLSYRGVVRNLFGVIWMMIAMGFISFAAAAACFVPWLLLFPIMIGSLFVLYRDVYGGIPVAEVAPS